MKPIEINLRRSSILALVLSVMHLLALASVWVLPWPVASSLTVLILASLVWCLRRKQEYSLEINAKGKLFVQQNSDRSEAKVLGRSLVSPWLTVLNLKLVNRRRPLNIVILSDSLDVQHYRKLRVWLRWNQGSEN